MGDNNGVSRYVHTTAVSHLDGLFGRKVSACSDRTGRLLAYLVDLAAAGQFFTHISHMAEYPSE